MKDVLAVGAGRAVAGALQSGDAAHIIGARVGDELVETQLLESIARPQPHQLDADPTTPGLRDADYGPGLAPPVPPVDRENGGRSDGIAVHPDGPEDHIVGFR